jgi:hypothetical protein
VEHAAIAELYAVASDGEAATLDRLRLRAGQVWEHVRCWTNPAVAARCQNCGQLRAKLEDAGEVATS